MQLIGPKAEFLCMNWPASAVAGGGWGLRQSHFDRIRGWMGDARATADVVIAPHLNYLPLAEQDRLRGPELASTVGLMSGGALSPPSPGTGLADVSMRH